MSSTSKNTILEIRRLSLSRSAPTQRLSRFAKTRWTYWPPGTPTPAALGISGRAVRDTIAALTGGIQKSAQQCSQSWARPQLPDAFRRLRQLQSMPLPTRQRVCL